MSIRHSKKIVIVSKPCCASSSVRRFLSLKMQENDMTVDVSNHNLGLNPHISAPPIHEGKGRTRFYPSGYCAFTAIRNPVEMPGSYCKKSKPDQKSNYRFKPSYDKINRLAVIHFVFPEKVSVGLYWEKFLPPFVCAEKLSPLNLDADACSKEGGIDLDVFFKVKDGGRLQTFLGEGLQVEGKRPVHNGSRHDLTSEIPEETPSRVSAQFSHQNALYDLRRTQS